MCEIHAIVRAHVAALGGNALISYFLSEFVVMHNPHKNQAQCLIHVGGDSVQVTYHQVSNLGLHAFLRISNNIISIFINLAGNEKYVEEIC